MELSQLCVVDHTTPDLAQHMDWQWLGHDHDHDLWLWWCLSFAQPEQATMRVSVTPVRPCEPKSCAVRLLLSAAQHHLSGMVASTTGPC
jgi:hypothetical protein